MSTLNLKPTHAPVRAYYDTLERFGRGNFDNEGNIRGAFERLLEKCAHQMGWTVVPEYKIARKGQHPAFVDAALVDEFNLPRAWWEAKDSKDDLDTEIQKKFQAGYPRTNILFQSPSRAVLVQNGTIQIDADVSRPEDLVDVLQQFFAYTEPHIREWKDAVREFSDRIPQIARGAMDLIEAERKNNKVFVERFAAFANVCRESISPDLKNEAVEKMLVQHLLTERIFRRIFDNLDFTRRNVIAIEIEKVIDSLTKKHFSRDQFLKPLDRFYKAIEEAASQTTSYAEKQSFLNVVYEKFFQRFDAKQADTHGIVYTPQPVVDFMVRSVEELLKQEFGRSLSDEGVHILDPFVGTGTFITRIMQEIRTSKLPAKYRHELHCNEIMLLPYYIASMNIEHAYVERCSEYESFEGICLVDTFELAEPEQATLGFMSQENTVRVKRQKESPIFVVIGNPPYNVGQDRENDNNKNRNYPVVDARIAATYGRDSRAQSKTKLRDPYVRAFRWASDRIGSNGVIAFVSNNSFIEKYLFDGMRSHLARDFDRMYIINLHGDVRRDSMKDGVPLGEKHTVFGLAAMVGIAVTFLVKGGSGPRGIHYAEIDFRATRDEKFRWLESIGSLSNASWRVLVPDERNTWLTKGLQGDFDQLIPMAGKKAPGIFEQYCLGVSTNRDPWVYNFDRAELCKSVRRTIGFYNTEAARWKAEGQPQQVDEFVQYVDAEVSWSRDLKADLKRGREATFGDEKVRSALYRPFTKQWLFFDRILNEEVYRQPLFFPHRQTKNCVIVTTDVSSRLPFTTVSCEVIPNLHVGGAKDAYQAFPYFAYDEDGSNCRENITDWALAEFRTHYGQRSISKWDIFHYTYAVLHHPEYRTRYAANLKRELPRIPFAPDFGCYAAIGQKLMDLHINYESQPEYPLERTEVGKLDWRVGKMVLSKDRTKLRYNHFLTLCGIPPDIYEYRLGNRSGLEWIVDQYRVTTDKRSGIRNDPNRDDDPEYIVRLIGQVVTVSLETVKLVRELAQLPLLAGQNEPVP